MYQYIWDAETGGLLLTTEISKFSKEPRPVYYKELDILGFNRFWNYPKDDSAPLMWAEANNYIYKGRTVARTKGGSVYTQPELVILDDPEPDNGMLEFVDIEGMVQKNQDLLETLTQETIQKIYNVYREYKNHVDVFYVAFSGGKDSVVALDLVQRSLTYVENAVKVFLQSQAKKRLKDLWVEKTGTKDPRDWSARFDTPILCMIDDEERPEAKEIFNIMMENSPSEMFINRAIEYLNRVTYFDRLANKELRDKCFMSRVVGDYELMLDDAQVVREYLIAHVTVRPYDWMDNSTVQNQIRMLAEKKYKTGGSEKVWAVVEKMDATELRHYLRDLISDNVKVGIEILKNK